jgi:hypothetical protein
LTILAERFFDRIYKINKTYLLHPENLVNLVLGLLR